MDGSKERNSVVSISFVVVDCGGLQNQVHLALESDFELNWV